MAKTLEQLNDAEQTIYDSLPASIRATYLNSLKAPQPISSSQREDHINWWSRVALDYDELSKLCSEAAQEALAIANDIQLNNSFVPPARKLPEFEKWRVQHLTGRTRSPNGTRKEKA
jgi:hypothetical protein